MRFIVKSSITYVFILLLLVSASVAETPRAKADDVGISSQRLQRIHELMRIESMLLRSILSRRITMPKSPLPA